MKILVTGAHGFIGKNLVAKLNELKHLVFSYDLNSSLDDLDSYCNEAEIVFHLAGINRPKNEEEFMEGNHDFTITLINALIKNNNRCPIVISSSMQAELDNSYGKSKKAAEEALINYAKKYETQLYIYRLPNVFGKWSKPNYNTVIATFCYNIARGLEIKVNDPLSIVNLVYIDDVIDSFLTCLLKKETGISYLEVKPVYQKTLGEIAELIYSFKESRINNYLPYQGDEFKKNLYATYLSFLETNDFGYQLKMNIDNRGSFTEFIRMLGFGQVSVNISKPGIIKGNHWHNTKNEKFLVVSGRGVIRFRSIDSNQIYEYYVSAEKLEVIDIPVGYTHNIENLGDSDMVTIMWASEEFDKDNPDTIFLEV